MSSIVSVHELRDPRDYWIRRDSKGHLWADFEEAPFLYELWSKLLKGGYIGDYIGDYYNGYSGILGV